MIFCFAPASKAPDVFIGLAAFFQNDLCLKSISLLPHRLLLLSVAFARASMTRFLFNPWPETNGESHHRPFYIDRLLPRHHRIIISVGTQTTDPAYVGALQVCCNRGYYCG